MQSNLILGCNLRLSSQHVATLREQLEQLAEERTADGLPRLVVFFNHCVCMRERERAQQRKELQLNGKKNLHERMNAVSLSVQF